MIAVTTKAPEDERKNRCADEDQEHHAADLQRAAHDFLQALEIQLPAAQRKQQRTERAESVRVVTPQKAVVVDNRVDTADA